MKIECRELYLNQGSLNHHTDAPDSMATEDLHVKLQYLIKFVNIRVEIGDKEFVTHSYFRTL